MSTATIDYAGQVLADVRRGIAVDDEVLAETKARRNLVKRHARSYPGALKTFDSGSVAHGTVNKPVSDADCGVVLDRRTYPDLGPDGDDVGPDDIVAQAAAHVIACVREEYPAAVMAGGPVKPRYGPRADGREPVGRRRAQTRRALVDDELGESRYELDRLTHAFVIGGHPGSFAQAFG